jgi:cytochrome c556
MKIRLAIVGLLAVVIGGMGLFAQEQKQKDVKQQLSAALMGTKLEHSKNILGGLATEDFEAISKGAKAMRALTALEQWIRADTPQYKAQLNVFWFANDALAQAADEKNLDAAALAYTQLTLSCVNCHKHVRGQATEKSKTK